MIPRIRQVQIQGFKSLERAVVKLEPLTVLVGPNGAGKSNFVGALTFLQQSVTEGLEQALRHGSALSDWRNGNGDRTLGIRVDLELAGALAEYGIAIRFGGGRRATVDRERCRVVPESGEPAGFEVAEGRFVQEIPGIRAQMEPDRLALFAASATEEFRPVYDFLTTIRSYAIVPPLMNDNRAGDSGVFLEREGRNAAHVLQSIIATSPESHARIERILSQAVEGITSIRVSQSEDRWLHIWFQKDVGLEKPGEFLERDMSDGTLRLLGLLLAVYQPSRPSVLIVEEPEATVHPAVAQLVTEILADASRDRQVLVTTHSPDILDAKELCDSQIRVVTQHRCRTLVAPLSHASRQAIRERLYTAGELLRIGELDDDTEQAEAAAANLDLFPPLPESV